MNSIRRALAIGAGFGLAAAAFDVWLGMIGLVQQRIGPDIVTLAQGMLVMIALGMVLGLAYAPALRSPGRATPFLHVAWMCGAWYLVERWIWIETPAFAKGALFRTFGSGALMLVALLLERFARRLAVVPWAFAGVAAIAGLAAPTLYLAATTPPAPPRVALPPAREGAPDVVLVVLDTVRAQNVASYGHARDTSPTFDSLAREGALFADATSPATWSLPSHGSLFTGRYPSSHGAYRFQAMLDSRFPTLAEVLAANGYETYCFTANPWISDGLGLTRGFAVQDLSWKKKRGHSFSGRLLDRFGLGETDKGGGMAADEFVAWRREQPAGDHPTFVFLNFIEAHHPYHQLPPEYRDRYTDLPPSELRRISLDIYEQEYGGPRVDLNKVLTPARALYDGGVAYTDSLLRRVVDAVRERGTLDRTVLVVGAHHREQLGEHGGSFGHGPSLYQQVIHVPLLVRYPPRIAPGTRVEVPVSTLGVFATILDLAGLDPQPNLQAGSLVRAGDGAAAEPVLSEAIEGWPGRRIEGNDPEMLGGQNLRAYRSGSWKLVEATRSGWLLYDVARDPTEARDLAAQRPEEVKRLAAELEAVRTRLALPKLTEVGAAGSTAPALDAATQQRLQELGYVVGPEGDQRGAR